MPTEPQSLLEQQNFLKQFYFYHQSQIKTLLYSVQFYTSHKGNCFLSMTDAEDQEK